MSSKKIIYALNFLIPICYVVVGFLLLTDLFKAIDRGKRLLFGVIVIGYGIFRISNTLRKIRDKT